jgi:phosphoribosylpyrophosphate synthetase
MTLKHQSTPHKKYNLMFVWTPDTADRISAVKKVLVESLWEDIPVFIQDFKKFADGSWNVEIEESVWWKHVYVYADYFSDYMSKELLMDINSRYVLYDGICDAIIRNRAKTLNIITWKYPFARSDKNEDMWMDNKPKRVPLYAKQVASHMSLNKVSNCISIDLHNPSVVWFFDWRDSRLTNLWYWWIIKKAIKMAEDQCVVELWSTDLWWAKKVDRVASALKLNSFVWDKSRDRTIPNSVASVKIHKWSTKITESDIKVYDDMLDTWWTIEKVVWEIDNNSPHSTDIIVTHWLFNWRAWEVLNWLHAKWKLRTLYITDTVYRVLDYPSYVKVIPTAPLIAKTIESLVNDQSIDYNYDWE